jgi:sugar lactone lactonase YvrE
VKTFGRAALGSLALLSLALIASAQQDVINTVAGGGPNGIPGINANLYQPYTVAVDSLGNVYVAASAQNRIFKISTAGIVTVVAGTGTAGYTGDGGKALNAELNSPWGVAVDGANPANVYIGDTANCLVRKVSQSTGIITTVAGKVTQPASGNPYSTCGYTGDNGQAALAELYGPAGLAVNPANDDVYVAEYYNGRVRKIAGGIPTGIITTFAGGGGSTTTSNNCAGGAPYGDGSAASSAYLCYPQAVSLDTTVSPVNVFISEYYRCDIREVVGSSAKIYQVAGSYTLGCGFRDNVVATSGQLNDPWQSHVSVSGATSTVTFADYSNVRVRQFTLTYAAGVPKPGNLITIAGDGSGGYCGDNGPALSACMGPVGVGFDASGNIYIGDYGADRVRKITKSSGYISTIDGWGANGGTNVTYSNPVGITNDPGTGLALYEPYGVFADPASTKVYLAGFGESATYVLNSATGTASDFAGNGIAGFAGDGTLANGAGTKLNGPTAFAKDSSGNIYIADQNNCAIREVFASTGGISTIAGGHEGALNGCGFSGNGGTAVNAQIYVPVGLAIDAANNIYLSEYAYCDVRKIAAGTGIITTYAGNEKCGYSGDGGLATNAELNEPYDLSVDGSGNLYIADTNNSRIRKVDAITHIITTVAGDGSATYNGDGPAVGVSLAYPQGVYADPNGNLFIADYSNDIVRWVSPTGQLITFGGTPPIVSGYYGFGGDGGVATSAQFAYPARITQDSSGNFYIADWNNERIRKINAFAGFGLSTATLNFETQPAGTISDFQGIAVSPIGPITISSVTTTAGFFEVDDCAGVTLAARETCEIDVYFNPTSAGKARGTLTIASNAYFPTSGNTVTLTGTGTGLGFTGSLAFGTQLINTTVSRTLTLTNTGSAVAIHGISLSLPTYFKLAGGTCPASGTLAAGGSCTIIVSFDPTTIGAKKDTLVVSSTDAASPLLVPATGNGTEVKLSASALAFGTITDGDSSTLALTVTNTASSGTLTISTALAGTGFALASGNTCTSPVAAGKSCVVPVSFAPTAALSYSGTLTLTTNGGSSPVIPLTGTGRGDAQLSLTSLAFGTIPDRNTLTTTKLTIDNIGPHAITLSSAFSGAGAAAFSISSTGNTCGSSIAAGVTCTLPVSFTPTSVGSFAATLTLTTNGGSNPTVSLSGSSSTDISVSAASIAFTTITHGTSETTNLTIKNLGTASLTVTPSISGTGAAAFSISTTGDTCSSAIAGGASCTLPVKFAPAAAQSYSATLTLTSNGGSNPTVTLTGTGK